MVIGKAEGLRDAGRGRRSRCRLLGVALFALALALSAVACERKGVTAQDRAVGERALQEARALVEAHPARIAGEHSKAVAEWIAGRLPSCAVTQVAFPTAFGEMVNVLALPKAGHKPVAIVASHFDTKAGIPGFVGANDGASTTGLLIALAEMTELPVAYLFLDGEECREQYAEGDGLLGAWRAARRGAEEMALPAVPVIVVDMLGDADFTPGVAENGSPRLKEAVRRAAGRVGVELEDAGKIIDDHVPFLYAGYQAVDVIDFSYGEGNAWWHSPEDTVEKLSAESLAKASALVRETVLLLTKEES